MFYLYSIWSNKRKIMFGKLFIFYFYYFFGKLFLYVNSWAQLFVKITKI